ncbi:MAG: AbrB/MazE/SpoVT family DNA-binding domain-containing protein [Candidatus Portnoybacteria bacterium]|nr:AbrB/MazE/SpoVT family DNA-binding domain-containing protein [Candidatus Portnoybacteria bacterium]
MKNIFFPRRILRVLPKGQITIPLPIREKFNIKPDDVMEIISTSQALILKPLKKSEEDVLQNLRIKEWGRYKKELTGAFERLSMLPPVKLPKLCR